MPVLDHALVLFLWPGVLVDVVEEVVDPRDRKRVEFIALLRVNGDTHTARLGVDRPRALEQVIHALTHVDIEPWIQMSEHNLFVRRAHFAKLVGPDIFVESLAQLLELGPGFQVRPFRPASVELLPNRGLRNKIKNLFPLRLAVEQALVVDVV